MGNNKPRYVIHVSLEVAERINQESAALGKNKMNFVIGKYLDKGMENDNVVWKKDLMNAMTVITNSVHNIENNYGKTEDTRAILKEVEKLYGNFEKSAERGL